MTHNHLSGEIFLITPWAHTTVKEIFVLEILVELIIEYFILIVDNIPDNTGVSAYLAGVRNEMRKIIYDYCYLCDGRGPLEKEKAALLPHSMFCRKIKFCSFQFDWVLCLRIGDTQDQHSSIWLQLSKCMIFMRLILQRLNLTSTTLQLEMRNVSNLMLQLNTFNLVRAIWCIWCFVKLCIRKFWHLDDVRSSKKKLLY